MARKRQTPISNRGLHMARVPGCQRVSYGWQVTCWDGKQAHNVGSFDTLPRARITWRLWNLWHQRGLTKIPTGNK